MLLVYKKLSNLIKFDQYWSKVITILTPSWNFYFPLLLLHLKMMYTLKCLSNWFFQLFFNLKTNVMIQQKGFIRLTGGSMGDTTFIKSANGTYRAQEEKVLPKSKFKNDPDCTYVINIVFGENVRRRSRLSLYIFPLSRPMK